MRSPVVVTNTRSVTEADLLVGRLRSQGIEALARTNLDRTTYAGLGGAVVIVDSEQRFEAELEIMMLESRGDIDEFEEFDDTDSSTEERDYQSVAGRSSWVRMCGYVALTAMAIGTVVPSLAVIWRTVGG